jgi:hypothetical protein
MVLGVRRKSLGWGMSQIVILCGGKGLYRPMLENRDVYEHWCRGSETM